MSDAVFDTMIISRVSVECGAISIVLSQNLDQTMFPKWRDVFV